MSSPDTAKQGADTTFYFYSIQEAKVSVDEGYMF